LGKVGVGIFRLAGRRFYIDSTRVDSMTTDYPIDMKETFRILGKGKSTLEVGIRQTAQWLRDVRGWRLPKLSGPRDFS
jgi:hypothetical protein